MQHTLLHLRNAVCFGAASNIDAACCCSAIQLRTGCLSNMPSVPTHPGGPEYKKCGHLVFWRRLIHNKQQHIWIFCFPLIQPNLFKHTRTFSWQYLQLCLTSCPFIAAPASVERLSLYISVGFVSPPASVEAFGGSAERPGLNQQDAAVSAGAEGAAGRAAEESLHLCCLLRRLHQADINLCRCQFPQTTQARRRPLTRTHAHTLTCTVQLLPLALASHFPSHLLQTTQIHFLKWVCRNDISCVQCCLLIKEKEWVDVFPSFNQIVLNDKASLLYNIT